MMGTKCTIFLGEPGQKLSLIYEKLALKKLNDKAINFELIQHMYIKMNN